MKKLKTWLRDIVNSSCITKFYIIGSLLAGLGFFLFKLNLIDHSKFQIIINISLFVFSIGFIKSLYQNVKKLWNEPWGAALISILSIVCGLFSVVLSRNLVSWIIGLPAQDFEIAVYSLTIIFCIPISLTIISFSLFVINTGKILLGYLKVILGSLFISNKKDFSLRSLGTLAGSISILILISQSLKVIESDKGINCLRRAVLLVAYFGDYQSAQKYPNTPLGDRIRLHENGVISTASITGLSVTIEVRMHE